MTWTIAAVDPMTGARGLLAEVHAESVEVSGATLTAFSRQLFERNIRVGLLITRVQTMVVRDTFSSMEFRGNRFSTVVLSTPMLLERAALRPLGTGERFMSQVVTWLEAIGSSWHSFLHESAVQAMVPDVVGHLVGATLEIWDDALDAHEGAA